MQKKIVVLGLGYIGLPTATIFATHKFAVHGVDVSQVVVDKLNAGETHFYEPDLDALVRAAVNDGYLKASTTVEAGDVYILAVPTPFMHDYQPDLSYVKHASEMIAPHVKKGDMVILESTSPVGATEKVAAWLQEKRPDLQFPKRGGPQADVIIAHCPERVLPGKIVQEIVDNDRIIGGVTTEGAKQVADLYRCFVRGACLVTDSRTAELAKLVENAYRDVNIAFANELSMIADQFEIDVSALIRLANHHPRVNILTPGPGVGGHCIAVDPWFIVDAAPKLSRLIRCAREVNLFKTEYVLQNIRDTVKRRQSTSVAFLGLAFKPNIDDLRESPAMSLVQQFASESACDVRVVEPHIDTLPAVLSHVDNVTLTDFDSAVATADVIVYLVKHDVFINADSSALRDKYVIDTCGALQASCVELQDSVENSSLVS